MIDAGQPTPPDFSSFPSSNVGNRKRLDSLFKLMCWIITLASLSVLVVLLVAIGYNAWPALQPRPDVLESDVWASVVQGQNEGNDPKTIDDGDLLQGIFVAEKLSVGGLHKEDDITFDRKNARLGVFSFQLTVDPSDATVLNCVPPKNENNIRQILSAAGFEFSQGSTDSLDVATIALLNSTGNNWTPDSIDGSKGFLNDGKIAETISRDSGWSFDQTIGQTGENAFCRLAIESRLPKPAGQNNELIRVKISDIKKLRRKKKLGQLTGLFNLIDGFNSQPKQELGVVKNRTASDSIVEGQFAIKPKDGAFVGLSKTKKRGFQFGGKFNLTNNPMPDQGNATEHLSAFLTQTPKTDPGEAGIGPALSGSLWVCFGCALFALPLGIGTAICLEEFKPKNKILAWFHGLVQLNITNLAGIPSIVYGIVGLTAFGTMFGIFGSPKEPALEFGAQHYFQYISEGERVIRIPAVQDKGNADTDNWVAPEIETGMAVTIGDEQVELNVVQVADELPTDEGLLARTLYADAEGGPVSEKPWYFVQFPFGRGVLAASLTLMLVILPVIIIATQESLRAIPSTLRQGALGLGSTRWQTVRNVTLPAAIPGIMTGAILAMSRAIGEAAPIIVLAGIVYITKGPENLMDSYSVLPIQIFHWAGLPIDNLAAINWQNVASAGIVVLLAILFSFNAIAISIRQWTQKPLS